jgi:hypothetical protein
MLVDLLLYNTNFCSLQSASEGCIMFGYLPLLESRASRWCGTDLGVDLCLGRGVVLLLPTRGCCCCCLYPPNFILAQLPITHLSCWPSLCCGGSGSRNDGVAWRGVAWLVHTSVIDKFSKSSSQMRRGKCAPAVQSIHDATIADHVAGREADQDPGQPEAAGPAAGA